MMESFQPLHRHEDWRLIVFLDGVTIEESLGRRGAFRRGDILFRPAFFAHADRTCAAGRPYTHLTLSARARRDAFARFGWASLRGRVNIEDVEARRACADGGDDLIAALGEAYNEEIATGAMARAAKALDEGAAARRVAAACGLSASAFTRRFAAAFGIAPRAYRLETQTQRALKALAESDQALSSLAAECGFHDQSHFCRVLRRLTGKTPGVLRRALAQA